MTGTFFTEAELRSLRSWATCSSFLPSNCFCFVLFFSPNNDGRRLLERTKPKAATWLMTRNRTQQPPSTLPRRFLHRFPLVPFAYRSVVSVCFRFPDPAEKQLIDLFKATIAAMRREQQQQRRGRQGAPSATVAPAAAAEWPQYMTPCLLLLDLLAKRSNVSKDDDANQKVEDGARNHDRAQQHHLRLRRAQQRDQGAPRPDEAGSASSAQPLLALPPSLSWQRGDREDGSGGTGAGGGTGVVVHSALLSSILISRWRRGGVSS